MFYADNAAESSLLADVFGYKSQRLDTSTKYARTSAWFNVHVFPCSPLAWPCPVNISVMKYLCIAERGRIAFVMLSQMSQSSGSYLYVNDIISSDVAY